MKQPGFASRLFEDTIFNRPHGPLTEEARALWARVEELQLRLCSEGPEQTAGLVAELMQAMESYHVYEKRDAFVLGFRAGGQAMREILER